MKMLTLWRPWDALLAYGWKPVENRGRPCHYRGEVLLIGGLKYDPRAIDVALAAGLPEQLADSVVFSKDGPIGATGVVTITGCCGKQMPGWHHPTDNCTCGPYAFEGQYHWKAENAVALNEPLPVKGFLGLRDVPDRLRQQVQMDPMYRLAPR